MNVAMGKILGIILVLVALAGGVVYYTTNQRTAAPVAPKVSLSTAIPTVTPVSLNTSDEALDSDLSALDKDLLELDKSDKALTNDINSL